MAPPGKREGPRPRAACGLICDHPHRLLPPRETVVRAEVGEPARVVHAFAAGDLRGRPGERISHRRHEPDRTHRDGERTQADQDGADGWAALRREATGLHTPGRRPDDERTDDQEHGEDTPVLDPVRAQGAVLDEGGGA